MSKHGVLYYWSSSLGRLRSSVIVSKLDTDFSGVFALAVERLPQITLAAARQQDGIQTDPCFANQVGLLVLAEYGDLQVVIVE